MQIKHKIIIAIALVCSILITITASMLVYLFQGNISSDIPENIAKQCEIKTENYLGRNVFIIKALQKQAKSKVIFYLHGGSYMAELTEEHWQFLSHLAQDTGATLIVPDYPLAPQYQYTDTFNMVLPLYQEIVKKVGGNKLIIMGDSAGGGMVLGLMEKIQEQNAKLQNKINEEKAKDDANIKTTQMNETTEIPSKIILISPWLDVTMQNPKIDEVQPKDTMLNKELLKIAGVSYAGSEEATKEYEVSPIYGSLEKINAITVYTGTSDILNPDVHKLQTIAKNQRSRC